MKNVLYIGLNGYAGAGKDTVAKMLKTILGHKWNSLEECKEFYQKTYIDPTWTATYHVNNLDPDNKGVLCVAYADQLKKICATIFGINYQRFYENKSNAWICINDKFQYTEIKPPSNYIITADEYYYGIDEYKHNEDKYWMSLREILVYVGTYVLQMNINKNTFVNIVNNYTIQATKENPDLEFVIVTDNRFIHELDYIREKHGITITITRDSIEQLDNIAEHDLDDVFNYDFTIDNSYGYDELFEQVWNLVHDNPEFQNQTINLTTRENINNYLRLTAINTDNGIEYVYKLCSPYHIQKIYQEGDTITLISLVGGPNISLNNYIETDEENLFVTNIKIDSETNTFYIYCRK